MKHLERAAGAIVVTAVLVIGLGSTAGATVAHDRRGRTYVAAECLQHIASVLDDEYRYYRDASAEISIMTRKCLSVGSRLERIINGYIDDGYSDDEAFQETTPLLIPTIAARYHVSKFALADAYQDIDG